MSIEQKIDELIAESNLIAEELDEGANYHKHVDGSKLEESVSLDISDYSAEEIEEFMVSEEYEQLDELSKKTLGSYIKKAKVDSDKSAFANGYDYKAGDEDSAEKHNAKSTKRTKGINKAVKKLTEESFSMQEDIDALLTGEELSEEFKEKTATIFEAAVLNRVKLETAKLEEKYEASVEARVDEEVKGLVEDINGFLSLMAEQWKKDNEVALEQSIKTEITETFINGLKNLFTESYIDIPEDKFDVVADLQEQLDKVASQLKEATDTNVELLKTINESKRTELINKLTEGLTDVDVEKFQSLAEEIKFDDAHTFEKKLTAIRESYFKVPATAKPIVESVVTDAIIEEEVKPKGKYVDPTVAMIAESINSKKKGSK